jgi:hypothetical protein
VLFYPTAGLRHRTTLQSRAPGAAEFRHRRAREVAETEGDGFIIFDDAEVSLAGKGDSKLPMRLRRLPQAP